MGLRLIVSRDKPMEYPELRTYQPRALRENDAPCLIITFMDHETKEFYFNSNKDSGPQSWSLSITGDFVIRYPGEGNQLIIPKEHVRFYQIGNPE
jgi:hypothetical protein